MFVIVMIHMPLRIAEDGGLVHWEDKIEIHIDFFIWCITRHKWLTMWYKCLHSM